MKKIGLISFFIGLLVLGGMWIAMKPAYDEMAIIAINNSTYNATVVTSTETSLFSILPFLIGGILLVWLVICLVRRGDNNGQ